MPVVFIADPSAGAATPPESPTRDRVLHEVSEHGPITAVELAGRLGLTATAVRRHLDQLEQDDLIGVHELPTGHRGRGRPARAFVLTDAGHAALASDYDDLATAALHFLAEHAGPAAVTAFARERIRALEERYAGELAAAGEDSQARARVLVDALTRDGFAASTRPVGDPRRPSRMTGVQLCQGHCPVQHVATEFPQFCDAETEAFSRLLGVHVQRLATLAQGDHVCTTFIPTNPTPASHAAAARATRTTERPTTDRITTDRPTTERSAP